MPDARPTEADAFRFALASLLFITKDTPPALRRCQARMRRALDGVAADPGIDPQLATATTGALRLACAACGKCPGVDGIRPPRRATELI